MPRGPRYNTRSPKTITPNMMWDATEKTEAEQKAAEERQQRIFYTEQTKLERETEERKQQALEIERHKRASYHYSCPFCGSFAKEHECEAYKKLLAEYTRNKQPIRAGVPWSFIVERYIKNGLPSPLPPEAYEGYREDWESTLDIDV